MKRFIEWAKLIAKFSFSFLIIGYMIYSGRLNMATVKQGFAHGTIIISCVFLLICSLIAALSRWRLLLLGQNLLFAPREILRYGMIGSFFNTTMPGAVSGDLIKAWYMVADHKRYNKTPILTSILLDRVMGVFGLVIVSSVPLFWNWSSVWESPAFHKVALLISLLALGVVFFFAYILLSFRGPLALLRKKMGGLENIKAGAMFLKFYDAWMEYRKCPWILLQALLLSVLTHLFVMSAVILCAYAIGETNLKIYEYFLLVPIGLLTTAVPIAPAGLGVGQVAFGALFKLLGSQNGAEIFTLFVSLQICLNLMGVFFYLGSPKLKPQLA